MKKNLLWIILLIDFALINVYAFVAGSFGELTAYLANLGPWGILATADLLVALTIGAAWMWTDARRRGLSPMPYLLLTLATGSLGLLVYLVRYGVRGPGRRHADEGSGEAVGTLSPTA